MIENKKISRTEMLREIERLLKTLSLRDLTLIYTELKCLTKTNTTDP